MIKFRNKEYKLKTLFIRDEAKLAKQSRRLNDADEEIKADAMVEIIALLTGIDKGDLNGCSMAEIAPLMRDVITAKNGEAEQVEAKEAGNAEAVVEAAP